MSRLKGKRDQKEETFLVLMRQSRAAERETKREKKGSACFGGRENGLWGRKTFRMCVEQGWPQDHNDALAFLYKSVSWVSVRASIWRSYSCAHVPRQGVTSPRCQDCSHSGTGITHAFGRFESRGRYHSKAYVFLYKKRMAGYLADRERGASASRNVPRTCLGRQNFGGVSENPTC